MARFPAREAEVRSLAHYIIAGLADNPALFPASPVTPVALQGHLDSFIALCDQAVAAQAAAELATAAKKAGYVQLTAAMKSVLRYAENSTPYDGVRLTLLGWGGRSAPTPNVLKAPGQPRLLEAPRQGEGWVFLAWQEPADGGAVASYRIERRESSAETWEIVDMAIKTEATLNNQERHKDWEYRVLAVNKAGEGAPSNTVAAVV